MLFKTVRADTPEQKREVFRLRYLVYCVENKFLDETNYPDHLESDEYDLHSQHALLVHKNSGVAVGTARMVLPKLGNITGKLPVFGLCPELEKLVPLETTAETSRFAISKEFRRRVIDGQTEDRYGHYFGPEDLAIDPRRIIPHISLGLLAISVRITLLNGCDHVCGIMEPTLLRLLARFGMEFQPVGPVIDHHGLRQPCYAQMDELLASIENKSYDLWEMITDNGRDYRRSTMVGPTIAAAAT